MNTPNFLVIFCDQLRWSETGCYGHPTISTPHIDGIAGVGTRFEVAASNCPVCMPARTVILSGQHARSCCGNVTNDDIPMADGHMIMPMWPRQGRRHFPDATLPELLRERGYRTAAIGKWHIDVWPDRVGFDDWVIPAHQHANSAQWFCENGGPLYCPPGFGIDHECEKADAFLRESAKRDAPFFLFQNFSPPHMPLADAPEKYLRWYTRDDVVIRPNVRADDPYGEISEKMLTYLWDYRHYRDHLPYTESLPDGFELTDLIAMYMGLTTWVDDAVGRVLASLESAGLSENTVVVFASDHGDMLGSHGHMNKGRLFDESIRIPMVWSGPGIARQTVDHSVASLVDLAPTLLEMAGDAAPASMQGCSLAGCLRNGTALDRAGAFIECYHDGIGIRSADRLVGLPWKNRHLEVADAPNFVFDCRADEFQMHNRAGQTLTGEEEALLATLRDEDARLPWFKPEPIS